MKNHIKFIFITFLAAIITFSSCTRIDAGHEGIKVNLYGSNKGVDNVELCTGMVWFNPVELKEEQFKLNNIKLLIKT